MGRHAAPVVVIDDNHVAEQTAHHLTRIYTRIRSLEARMAITQSDLDNLADELVADTGAIQQEIQRLQSQNPDLDLTGLRQAVSNVGALVPSNTGGGTPPVADDPDTPVVPAPSDGEGNTATPPFGS